MKARDFDKQFHDGADVTRDLDLDRARRRGLESIVADVKARNADADPAELETSIEEALMQARARRPRSDPAGCPRRVRGRPAVETDGPGARPDARRPRRTRRSRATAASREGR